jgi:hypothetical protein
VRIVRPTPKEVAFSSEDEFVELEEKMRGGIWWPKR